MYDVIIVGMGISGITAGIYLKRANGLKKKIVNLNLNIFKGILVVLFKLN